MTDREDKITSPQSRIDLQTTFLNSLSENLHLYLYCYNSPHSSGRAFHRTSQPDDGDLLPFSQRSFSEVEQWCREMAPGAQDLSWAQRSELLHNFSKEFLLDLTLCMDVFHVATWNRPWPNCLKCLCLLYYILFVFLTGTKAGYIKNKIYLVQTGWMKTSIQEFTFRCVYLSNWSVVAQR